MSSGVPGSRADAEGNDGHKHVGSMLQARGLEFRALKRSCVIKPQGPASGAAGWCGAFKRWGLAGGRQVIGGVACRA